MYFIRRHLAGICRSGSITYKYDIGAQPLYRVPSSLCIIPSRCRRCPTCLLFGGSNYCVPVVCCLLALNVSISFLLLHRKEIAWAKLMSTLPAVRLQFLIEAACHMESFVIGMLGFISFVHYTSQGTCSYLFYLSLCHWRRKPRI